MNNLKNTSSATKWVATGIIVKQGMRLASNLIMTRILLPEAFGLMAIVNLVIQALNMLSDIGLGPSIIRSSRSDDEYLRTAWTVQVVRGLFLWFVTILVAWPISQFYQEPLLLYVLPCSGLIALLMGFNSISSIQNQKNLLYKKLIILESVAALIGLAAMVICGFIYSSVWALVLGGVLSTFSMTLFSHLFLARMNHSFCWNKEVVHELFHFGKWVFISTALTFFVGQYDKLALGKLADMKALGLYSIAMVWSQLPIMIVGQLNDKVFYPVITEYNRSGDLQKIMAIRNAIIKLSCVICLFIVAVGHIIIDVLYEAEYSQAGELLSILGILGWFQIIEGINTNLLLAIGRPKDKIVSQLAGLLVLVSGISFAYSNYAMHGVAGIAAISMMMRAFILDLQLRKDKMRFLLFDITMTCFLISLGFCIHWLFDNLKPSWTNEIILAQASILTGLMLVFVFLKQTELRRLMHV